MAMLLPARNRTPGQGVARSGAGPRARVGTCAGDPRTRGPERRGTAALYRAARSELQRGRRPTPRPPSAIQGPRCPAGRSVTASGPLAGVAPP